MASLLNDTTEREGPLEVAIEKLVVSQATKEMLWQTLTLIPIGGSDKVSVAQHEKDKSFLLQSSVTTITFNV